MAVNVSRNISVCLYCKTSSETNSDKEFHEIFDEVGLELQLPTLVETFFHRKPINEENPLLCEDCVNNLIELYDLEEHAKVEEVALAEERAGQTKDETGSGEKESGGSIEQENTAKTKKSIENIVNSDHNPKLFKDTKEIPLDKPEIAITNVSKPENTFNNPNEILKSPVDKPKISVKNFNKKDNLQIEQDIENSKVPPEIQFINVAKIKKTNIEEEILYVEKQLTEIPKVNDELQSADDYESKSTAEVDDLHYDDHISINSKDNDHISINSEEVSIQFPKDNEEVLIELDDDTNLDCQEIEDNKVIGDDHYSNSSDDYEGNISNVTEDNLPQNAHQEFDDTQYNAEILDYPANDDDKPNETPNDTEDNQYDEDNCHNDNRVFNYTDETPPQNNENRKNNHYDLTQDDDLDSDFTNKELISTNRMIPCEELEIIDENDIDVSGENIHDSTVSVSLNSGTIYIGTNQNDIIEENIYDNEESVLECNSLKSVESLYEEMVLEELIQSDEYDENAVFNIEDLNSKQDNNRNKEELNCIQENNDDIQEIDSTMDSIVQETNIDNNNEEFSRIQVNNDDIQEIDNTMDSIVPHENIENSEEFSHIQENNDDIQEIDNTISSIVQKTNIAQKDDVMDEELTDYVQDDNITEEEYLIEEIICSQEFDSVDLNEYLDNVFITNFETFELQWTVECKLCLEKYNSFQDLLKHACINELIEEQQCCCIFKGCDEIINNVKALARHWIINHYDKIEKLAIYGRCPDCEKNFSNLMDFNKHSCCRSIKRRAGARNYCQSCNMDFQSLKRYVFHMQFHLTKHRPKICLLCGALFTNSNSFFEHTQYNHEPDTAMACVICDRFFNDLEGYENHKELHEESKYIFECRYCPKKYTHKSGLSLHMDVYHNHKTKPSQCEYCDKEFASTSSYRNHMKSHEPETEIPAFVCSECGLISNNADLMKDHVDVDNESPCYSAEIISEDLTAGYTCENCSIDFQSQDHLQKHRLSINHSSKLFYCSICRRAFKTLRHMRNHSINHKDFEQWQEMFPIARYYMCNIGTCQESYPIWTSLYYHKKRPHTKNKHRASPTEFKCQFCQGNYTSKMSLAVHISRSHNKTNIHCPECNQSYKNKRLLQNHIDKFHTVVKCKLCFKDFKNRRNYESHEQLVHFNEKRYFSKHCSKGYFYKSEMDAHVKNVHSEISYKCEICNFITNYPKSLEIHLNKHNNKLNFKCTFCPKAFGREQLLKVHMKRHQEPKEYICSEFNDPGCTASFITHNLLKNHIIEKHRMDDQTKQNLKRRREALVLPTQVLTMNEKIVNSKRPKISKEVEFQEDSIELISDNETPESELKNEITIEYENEMINDSE